jgi:hypothetical protein
MFLDKKILGQNFPETLHAIPGYRGMNSKKILLAATLVGGLLSAVVASAAVVIDQELIIKAVTYTPPAPVKVVVPTGISRRFQGEIIRLRLTVDVAGLPHNIDLCSGRDPNLVRHLLPVVAQWQFTPAMRNGQPVSADIVLPVEIVETPAS